MSTTHGLPKNPIGQNADQNAKFNPVSQAVEDLPFEAVENVMEDFAKLGFKGKGLIAQTFKHPVLVSFLKKRTLTFPIVMTIAAIAAKVGQKFGMGNTLAAIVYEFTKHSLAGFAEGAHEAIKLTDEQREERVHHAVDEILVHIPDVVPDQPENLFKGRIRKGDSVIHATHKDCSIVMSFTDGHDAGSKNREKLVALAMATHSGGGGKKGDKSGGTEMVMKELKGGDTRVEYHTGNVSDLIQIGNTFLCKLCYPDGLPKEKPKEHKEEPHKAEAESIPSALTTLSTRVGHAVGLVKKLFEDEEPVAAPKDQSRVVDALMHAQSETDPEKQARAFLDAADLMDD